MNTFTVELQVPDGLRELGFSDEDIRREVPTLLVLKRFRQGAVSSSKAARILNLSRREFLDLLVREGIPIFEPSETELAAELATIQKLGAARP